MSSNIHASCKCGEVVFELSSAPYAVFYCSCDDCITHAKYVDGKARAAGVDNISLLEEGNDQAIFLAYFDRSTLCKLVQGGDKIVRYKLRSSSTTYRSYTSCCYTCVYGGGGKGSTKSAAGAPFNAHTLANLPQPLTPEVRMHMNGVLRMEEYPKDDLPHSNTIPIFLLLRFLYYACFSRFVPDAEMLALLDTDVPKEVNEVAGAAAFKAAGYTG
jgi:hypothetical protein